MVSLFILATDSEVVVTETTHPEWVTAPGLVLQIALNHQRKIRGPAAGRLRREAAQTTPGQGEQERALSSDGTRSPLRAQRAPSDSAACTSPHPRRPEQECSVDKTGRRTWTVGVLNYGVQAKDAFHCGRCRSCNLRLCFHFQRKPEHHP